MGINGGVAGGTPSHDCIPGQQCPRSFPVMYTGALLGGFEVWHRSSQSSLRTSIGPAILKPGDAPTMGGIQARAALATPPMAHLALIVYGQHSQSFGATPLRMTAAGVGLQIR